MSDLTRHEKRIDTSRGPELTDELAEVLAAVADNTLDLASEPDDAEPAWRRRQAVEKRAARLTALSLLEHLGYVSTDDDGEWFDTPAGREALAARQAALEAETRRKVAASYEAVAAELHAIADAIASVPTGGLVELQLDLRIQTTYAARDEQNPAKVATVDAVADVLLDASAVTSQLGSSDTWQHKVEGRRGPIKVEVYSFVEDPSAREREQAERERAAELDRLRAELAERNVELAKLRSDDSGGAA